MIQEGKKNSSWHSAGISCSSVEPCFVPEWGCYLLECSWNEIHLLLLDSSQGLGTFGKLHLPSADSCCRFVSALWGLSLKLTDPEKDLLHTKTFSKWFWGEEVEEIPKKSLGYSQQGMLDAATSSLGSHWWALLPPNQGLHKTSKENPFICCSERLVLLQERWRHYPEMFSSELGPGMSCWKGSNIYSSTGTQRFVQGEICRHCTPLTPRAGVYGGLMI